MRKALSDLKQYLSQLSGVEHPKVEIAEIKWKDTKIEFDGAEFRAQRSAFMFRVNEGAPALFRQLQALLREEIKEANGQLAFADVLAEERLTKLIANRQEVLALILDSEIVVKLVISVTLPDTKKTLQAAIGIVEKIEKLLV